MFTGLLDRDPPDITLVPYCSGDPSVFGNLPPHPAVTEGVRLALESGGYHGYGHSSGLPEVRAAVAKEFSRPGAPLTAQVYLRFLEVSEFSHSK